MNEDAQRLSHESVKIQNAIDGLTQDLAALKLSIQEQNIFLDGLKPNQEILQQDVSSLKQKVEDMQFVSYDGTLIWKIANFKEKMSKIDIDLQFRSYKEYDCQSLTSTLINKSLHYFLSSIYQ